MENVITLDKLLSLWFCFLLHSILFLISQTSYCTYKIISSNELARPLMGTIFLVIVGRALVGVTLVDIHSCGGLRMNFIITRAHKRAG